MHNERLAKKWKCAEIMLFQASEFLDEPSLFSFEQIELEQYQFDLRERDIFEAMESLATLGALHNCKSGFWRCIKKVAIQIDAVNKADEYEKTFNIAVSKNV
jgi:hypothetical protein